MGFFEWFLSLFQEDPHADLQRHQRKDCALRLLADVRHPDHRFRMINGLELRNMCDLADALEVVDEGTFSFHVNDVRNDFAEWVKDVLGDHALADKLSTLSSKEDFAVATRTRVNYFKRMIR
jgi:hypothetical protein